MAPSLGSTAAQFAQWGGGGPIPSHHACGAAPPSPFSPAGSWTGSAASPPMASSRPSTSTAPRPPTARPAAGPLAPSRPRASAASRATRPRCSRAPRRRAARAARRGELPRPGGGHGSGNGSSPGGGGGRGGGGGYGGYSGGGRSAAHLCGRPVWQEKALRFDSFADSGSGMARGVCVCRAEHARPSLRRTA